MYHTSQSNFGRPMPVALPDDCARLSAPNHAPQTQDKWELLAALTEAAQIYDLNHRTLGVLKALLTFWPERPLPAEPRSCIVFPSNRTLSERLNGMPESTLRRHLSKLITLGIVDRHDSANHKRFARRRAGAVQQAYGFDLSPLARHADHLYTVANTARDQKAQIIALRDKVAILRQDLIAADTCAELVEEARILLRRKPNFDRLTTLAEVMTTRLAERTIASNDPAFSNLSPAPLTTKVSTSDSQNERHIQNSIKQDFDSERQGQEPFEKIADKRELAKAVQSKENQKEESLSLQQVLASCPEVQSYFPDQIKGWDDLLTIAHRLAPMLGIDQPVLQDAKQRMGALPAAISMMCILQRATEIRSPGAYLRRLAQKAAIGGFSVLPMLNALKNQKEMA